MSAFKVGDVVEVLWVHNQTNASLVGREYVVASMYHDGVFTRVKTYPAVPIGCTDWKYEQLRLKRPPTKDDAEPLLDHVPCEGDWLEDFKRSMRKPVKA